MEPTRRWPTFWVGARRRTVSSSVAARAATNMGSNLHKIALEIRPPSRDDVGLLSPLATYRPSDIAAFICRLISRRAAVRYRRCHYKVETTIDRIIHEAERQLPRHRLGPAAVCERRSAARSRSIPVRARDHALHTRPAGQLGQGLEPRVGSRPGRVATSAARGRLGFALEQPGVSQRPQRDGLTAGRVVDTDQSNMNVVGQEFVDTPDETRIIRLGKKRAELNGQLPGHARVLTKVRFVQAGLP